MAENMELVAENEFLAYIFEDWKLWLFLTIVGSIYYYGTCTFTFFENKGISYIKPIFFIGSLWKRMSRQISFPEFQVYVYDYFKGKPYGGIYEARRPTLYLFDPELIKAVTVRDFEHFVDRNTINSNEPRYLKRTLLNLKGAEWKIVRSAITPSFSSARLKNMIPLIQQSSDQMVNFLQQYDKCDVEMKDLVGHFTLEVIGACAFGIKTDALTDENAHFFKLAKQFGYITPAKKVILFLFLTIMPKMMKYFNISFLNPVTSEELVKILKITKAERRKAESMKSDFLQLIINAANKEKEEAENPNAVIHLDDDTIDAQSFLFLIAGYETSSTLLSFGINILARNQQLQNKLREHIQEVTDGKEITYELLTELTYLEGFLLGMRFSMISAKIAMVSLLKNFKFSICSKTEYPVTIDKASILLKPANGLWVKIENI